MHVYIHMRVCVCMRACMCLPVDPVSFSRQCVPAWRTGGCRNRSCVSHTVLSYQFLHVRCYFGQGSGASMSERNPLNIYIRWLPQSSLHSRTAPAMLSSPSSSNICLRRSRRIRANTILGATRFFFASTSEPATNEDKMPHLKTRRAFRALEK